MSRHTATPKSVHLLHLDLGIGGAERLMVNVALSLLKLDFEVTIVTTHHDLQHCFDECKASGALHGKIRVYGNWLPRQILGRGTALCSHIRILYASLCLLGLHCYAILCGRGSGSDRVAAMVVDGISSPLPLFLWASIPTVFYCHYPDLLLCTSRTDPLTSLYRLVLDTIEEVTTGCADVLLVNSLFTKDVFRQAFPQLWRLVQPDVLYPCLEEYAESTDSEPPAYLALGTAVGHVPPSLSLFVSLNRFERKKQVELALEALALVKSKKLAPSCKGDMPKALLVIAGGYDPRVLENIEYLEELKTRANELGLVWSMPAAATVDAEEASGPISSCDVVFRLSIAAHERNALLQYASALLYTPDKEHFGIVPIEAMRAGKARTNSRDYMRSPNISTPLLSFSFFCILRMSCHCS